MSGNFPYIYLALGPNLTSLGPSALQYLYSGAGVFTVTADDADLFEAGCVAVRPIESEFTTPIGTYDISYPYCRVALSYNMADVRGNPQIGQFVPQAPFFAILVRLVGCDQSLPISVSVDVQPAQTICVVSLYPGYSPTDFYTTVDVANAVFPMRLYFTVTNGSGTTRTFWIGIRDTRSGLISGAVVPNRGQTNG
jgi:hypothetical protein